MIVKLKHHLLDTAKAIIHIQKAAYLAEAALIEYEELPPLKEKIDDIIKSEEVFLGIYSNEKLSAVLSYCETENCIEICRLVVIPALFGNGLASKLLHHLSNDQTNKKTIFVHTAAKNIPAIQLYQKFGFIIKNSFVLADGLTLVKLEK